MRAIGGTPTSRRRAGRTNPPNAERRANVEKGPTGERDQPYLRNEENERGSYLLWPHRRLGYSA